MLKPTSIISKYCRDFNVGEQIANPIFLVVENIQGKNTFVLSRIDRFGKHTELKFCITALKELHKFIGDIIAKYDTV